MNYCQFWCFMIFITECLHFNIGLCVIYLFEIFEAITALFKCTCLWPILYFEYTSGKTLLGTCPEKADMTGFNQAYSLS